MDEIREKKGKIKSPWVKGMLAGFGALALAIMLFLLLYNVDMIADWLGSAIALLRPFIIGGAIAYILSPLCNSVERWFTQVFPEKFRKAAPTLAVVVSIIFLVLIVYLLIIMIIPQLYTSIVTLSETFPPKAEAFMKDVMKLLENNKTISGYVTTAYESIESAFENWLKNKILPDMASIISGLGTGVKSVLSVLIDIVIGAIVAVYFLMGRRTFSTQARMVLYSISGQRWGDIIRDELKYADKMFNSFLSGKFVDSAIIGIICYFFCIITNMPNSLLVSVIIAITNIIPFFGPFIGAIPMGLLILVENPMKALWFAIFILILQQIDGNIIGPKILGDSTGLSSFWILFAIMVFGGIFGFIGMIIGVPLFAVIYDIVKKLVKKSLAKKNISEEEYV